MKFRILFWVLAAIIAVLALYPALELPEPEATGESQQYYNHVFAYATLIIVGTLGWGLTWRLIIGVMLGAVALELGQYFSPGREVTSADMIASLGGVMLGVLIVSTATKLRYRMRGA